MKKNNFWFFSLVVLWVIAENTNWPTMLRIAIIANALIVLYQCISAVVIDYRNRKEDKKHG